MAMVSAMVSAVIAAVAAMMPVARIAGMAHAAPRNRQPGQGQSCGKRHLVATHRFSPE
jgi:hypothetical protein